MREMHATLPATLPPLNWRRNWAWLLCLSIAIALAANNIAQGLADWHFYDLLVYHDAAMRVREGGQLYGGDALPWTAYRYAPWFAYAWVPLTYLPAWLERGLWTAVLLAATALAVWPLVRPTRELAFLALLLGSMLFGITTAGNAQALMVAGLIYGLRTRWGWVAVGLAGSLKVAPLAFVAVFVARRQWWQAIGATVLAVSLWAPMLFMVVDPITFDSGPGRLFPTPIWLISALAVAGFTLWLAWRRSEMTPIAAGVAALAALPRLGGYDVTVLMVPPALARDELLMPHTAIAGHGE